MKKDDLLTADDLSSITGVPSNARNKFKRMTTVLENAGIFYWIRDDLSIATTWHHVHCAGNDKALTAQPDFRAVS